jgi:cytochrome c-type biogenesis protein CcmF
MSIMAEPFNPTMDRIRDEALSGGVAVEDVLQSYMNAGFYLENLGFVDGTGLNPMLQSIYNSLHPPLIFFSYGLGFVVFALSLVYLVRGQGDWEAGGRTWARASWLMMTAAMAVGGLWAYEELAYGGYWTWDPIEAASLLPWITLTAYLHGSVEFRRRHKLGTLTPFIGVLTTLLIIYSTYITRSGIVKSSHSYSETSSAGYLIIFVLALSAVASYFAIKRMNLKAFKVKVNFLSQSTLIQLSVLGILAAAVVVFWGLTSPVVAKINQGSDVVTPPEFYNHKSYFPALFLIFIGGMSSLLGPLKKNNLTRISALILILSIVFYIASIPTSHPYVNALLPVILFSVGGLIYKTAKSLKASGFDRAIYGGLFANIVHLGITLVIASAVVSGSLSTAYDMTFDFNRDRGSILEMETDFSVRLDDIKVFQNNKGDWVQDAFLTVIKNDGSISSEGSRMINDRRYGHRHSPFIVRGLSDVYGVFYGVGHQSERVFAFFNFKVIPFVNLIWIGIILLLTGMGGVIYLGTIENGRG